MTKARDDRKRNARLAFQVAKNPAVAEQERLRAYNEGRWCGECQYGVVMDPPCCTRPDPS